MKIGVIGSGNMGSGLGRIWAGKGHEIIFSYSRSQEKLSSLAASAPNAKTGTPAEAAQAEVILLSVRWSDVPDALKQAGSLNGKIVIDCTNPLKPDLSGLELGHTSSAAEEIARMAPGAKVVKAFNTAFAQVYEERSRLFGSRRASMFYCGDDAEAKSAAARLITDVGFDPVDCGPLTSARLLEPVAMLVITLGYGMKMGTNMALDLIRR
ncbi:MAG: NADPH-dependent F420 reductase [Nitrospirae bacterium]|nr:NADPH-dependent F420 reductase [Nitrospirota bacterium]